MPRAVIALLLLLVPAAAHADKRVALVIGIDKYDNLAANAQLQRARSDAAAIAAALKELHFDVIARDDPTRSAFNNHWQDFLNKLEPGDTAAFYFAGHGVEFGGRSYLLPRDVPNLKPGRDELLRREALSLQEFLADLRERGTRLNLVILDACRDNPFEPMAGRSVGSTRGLVAAEPPEGTFIMYSAGTGESALDRLNEADRDANSVYTRHLLMLLKAPGLTLTDVAEQVRVAVRQVAATVQHRQTPAYYNQVLGRVCIAGGDCGPRLAASPTTPTSTAAADAARVCREVEGMSSLSMLGVLANQHKGTPAGDCIAARMGELKKREVAMATAPTVEVAQGSNSHPAYARASGLFTAQDAERVAAIVKKHKFLVPTFDFAIPNSHIALRVRKLLGVWASDVGYNGTGRQVMLIVTDVAGSHTIKGFNAWGPPTGSSFSRHPAGFQEFGAELVGDTLTWGSASATRHVVQAADASLTITDKLTDGRMASTTLKPIWRLVDALDREKRSKAK